MIIYQKTKAEYIDDVDANVLSKLLNERFIAMTGWLPVDHRVWGDEYRAFSRALHRAEVADDVPVAIEYHLSAIGRFRVDVLLAGNDGVTDRGVIIELKAWSEAESTTVDELVATRLGGGRRLTQHPCVQAAKYRQMIIDYNRDLVEARVEMEASAYLYNLYRRDPEPLEEPRYRGCLDRARLFLADDVGRLRDFLERTVPRKPKKDVFWLLEHGRLLPSKALIDRVGSMLAGNPEFDLIDEQNEAYQIIRHALLDRSDRGRQAFIVRGGPGTGKSVIAVRLLSEILRHGRMGCIVAPNAAFRKTIVEGLAKEPQHRLAAESLFRSSWNFHASDYSRDQAHEFLIVDEAHRLKDTAFQYRGSNMVDDLVRAARVSVFFLDETQRVSWNDIGSEPEIRKAAARHAVSVHEPIDLVAQFRCNGSAGYLNWLDDVLQIRATGNFAGWGGRDYDFRVFDRGDELYEALRQKDSPGSKARVIAGYSWEWPRGSRSRSSAAAHVQAGGLSLPWNFDDGNWATSRDGFAQVGCVHTCQGLEFDWVGILIGADLAFSDSGGVVGIPERRARTDASLKGWKSASRNGSIPQRDAARRRVQEIIKNTYKVLLTRGRKGCFVWCADQALGTYLKKRLVLAQQAH